MIQALGSLFEIGSHCSERSVEDVSKVVIGEQLHVLLAGSTEAVKKIIGVGLRELNRAFEAGLER